MANNYVDSYFEPNVRGSNNRSRKDRSQNVYSLIPAAHGYENDDRICRQISLLSTKLFFDTDQFENYAKKFSGILKILSEHSGATVEKIKSYNPISMFKNYQLKSEFIRGSDVSKKIMEFALTLGEQSKASLLLVVGGHTVNVLVENTKGGFIFCYYDPYFGQVYAQFVTKSKIEDVLSGRADFHNKLSILNKNNVLLGRALLREDTILDLDLSFSFMTSISKLTSAKKAYKITFAEDISYDDVLQYIVSSNMITDVLYATDRLVFKQFIDTYKAEILSKFSSTKFCMNSIEYNCPSNYLKGVIDYQNSMTVFRYQSEKNVKSSFELFYSDLSKKIKEPTFKSAKICIKDVSSLGSTEENDYFKLIFKDKTEAWKLVSQCGKVYSEKESDSNTSEKNSFYKLTKELCFKSFNDNKADEFSRVSQKHYAHRDELKARSEDCLDLNISFLLDETQGNKALSGVHDET